VQLVVVGVSHNSAPVALRERLTVPHDSIGRVLSELRESVPEVFVLSTCNRVELYAVCGHESSGAELLRQYLASRAGFPARTIRDASYAYGHQSAVRHLLRVAAGLDSMVLGENEILGQLRRAIGAARQVGTVGPVLDKLGDAAVACGKRTRTMTSLGRDGSSVASVAVRCAIQETAELQHRNVLVLGAGETARAAVSHLAPISTAHVTIMSRTHDRAVELAGGHGMTARRWEELSDALAGTDIVIACTGASAPVIDAETLARARHGKTGALLCIDLALPRDIDPAAASVAGVRLIDLDRIEAEAAAGSADRSREVAHAESIVDQETERYMEWWRGRGVATTIARLHQRAREIRAAELDRALARLPGLDAQGRDVVRDLAVRMAAKLLHEPTLALKRDPEGANMAVVVERLFALGHVDDLASDYCATRDRRAEDTIHHQESNVA
jgi:glutamyl-tRNA reductase